MLIIFASVWQKKSKKCAHKREKSKQSLSIKNTEKKTNKQTFTNVEIACVFRYAEIMVKYKWNEINWDSNEKAHRLDEFPYLFPFHLATESASLKVYY